MKNYAFNNNKIRFINVILSLCKYVMRLYHSDHCCKAPLFILDIGDSALKISYIIIFQNIKLKMTNSEILTMLSQPEILLILEEESLVNPIWVSKEDQQ